MRKIMKFGGTSVGSGEAMSRTADIIQSYDCQRAVVVSAMSGVTNSLLEMMDDGGKEVPEYLNWLRQRHLDAAHGNISPELMPEYLEQLEYRLSGLGHLIHLYRQDEDRIMYQDALASWGERLSSLTLSFILRSRGTDSLAMTSEEVGIVAAGPPGNGGAVLPATEANLRRTLAPLLSEGKVPIITGYYGVDGRGRPLTFGRGGSDYSAAVVGHGVDADVVEIWTDVDGFMSADPRVVKGARTISEMDYGEAAELAYFGAKVLHPRTIEPAKRKGVAVLVKNTFNPSGPGTRIHGLNRNSQDLLRSVALKTGLSIVKIYSSELVYQPDLVARILEAISSDGTTIYAVSTSLSTLAVVLPSDSVQEACARLKGFRDQVEAVKIKEDAALICAVGDGMLESCGVSAKIFAAVADVGANVELISEGASDIALNFMVGGSKAADVVRRLHELYIGA
ncbi:Bifunctional aspartokinase/homoserine dehydrogenase 1 [anaerobic digester metagenome]|nr:aspartate kinase [Methanomassiliicoccales archaeon]